MPILSALHGYIVVKNFLKSVAVILDEFLARRVQWNVAQLRAFAVDAQVRASGSAVNCAIRRATVLKNTLPINVPRLGFLCFKKSFAKLLYLQFLNGGTLLGCLLL